MPWINHWPPVCWSTFWKSSLTQQLPPPPPPENPQKKPHTRTPSTGSHTSNKMANLLSAWGWLTLRHASRITFVFGGFTVLLYLTTMGSLVQVVTFPVGYDESFCMQNPEPPTHRGIPKHIHQMWKTHEVPTKWRDQQEHCRKLNPDFEYTLWSDDDILAFLKREYPWFVSTYLSYPYPISRPDAARYFILYHFGGVYLDIDIDCKTPFKQIVNVTKGMDTVLAATAPFGITNNFMASEAGDTFLKYVVQGLVAAKGWYVVPHMTVMLSAGPLYVFSRYNSYPCKDRIKLITVEDHKRFFHHEQAATWHNWDGRVVIWLDHHHTVAITVIIVAITIVILGIIRWTYRRFKQNRPPFKKFCACSRGDTV